MGSFPVMGTCWGGSLFFQVMVRLVIMVGGAARNLAVCDYCVEIGSKLTVELNILLFPLLAVGICPAIMLFED